MASEREYRIVSSYDEFHVYVDNAEEPNAECHSILFSGCKRGTIKRGRTTEVRITGGSLSCLDEDGNVLEVYGA